MSLGNPKAPKNTAKISLAGIWSNDSMQLCVSLIHVDSEVICSCDAN